MLAAVEKLDGTWEVWEMGEPTCSDGECKVCGCCLGCGLEIRVDDESRAGSPQCEYGCLWVLHLVDPRNPFYKESQEKCLQS